MKLNTHGEHIGVQLVDEQFKVLTRFDDNFRHIHDHLLSKFDENPSYPFVSTIDPYSSTLFNSVQVPKLINELEQLKNEDNDNELKESVGRLVEYLKTITVHEFIMFLGD